MPRKKKTPGSTPPAHSTSAVSEHVTPLPSSRPISSWNEDLLNQLLDTPCDTDEAGLERVATLMFKHDYSEPAARLAITTTPEGHPTFPYRLETVAHLAARLTRNGGSLTKAAADAITLLDACRTELSRITEQAALSVLAQREAQGIHSSVELPLAKFTTLRFSKNTGRSHPCGHGPIRARTVCHRV